MSLPKEDTGGAFGGRGAAWLAALAAGSLAAAGFLGAFGDALYDPPSFGPDGFSRSAVGHRAFAELVRALGFHVLSSRHDTAGKARAGAVVALIEPRIGPDDELGKERAGRIGDVANALLVVLPKRAAIPDPVRPRFIAAAELEPVELAQRALDALGIDGKVIRQERSQSGWRGELPLPTLEAPQLVTSKRMHPLVANDDGILVGEIDAWEDDGEEDEEVEGAVSAEPAPAQSRPPRRWHTIVVADPDLLATHGLGKGENAILMVRLLERLGADERHIVLDETLHGLEQQPSLALELVRFPLVLSTVSALLVGVLLAWGAVVRFGRPRPPEPGLGPGRVALVESSAGLLRHGGHFAHAAAAYLRAAKERVAAKHQLPGEGGDQGAWLGRLAEARGKAGALRAIEERVQRLAARRVRGEEEAVRTAQAIHRWREEMTDGADRDPRDHRAAQG